MTGTVFAPGSISMRLYPHNDLPVEQIVSTFLSQAKHAEKSGFDGIMTAEHHGGFGGYMPNPLQMAGWALEVTNLKWTAACPILLPLKPNALVIEEIAWMAARFPGRVGCGMGAGSLELDFQIMDQQKEGYIQRFLAAMPIVTRALSGGDAGLLKDDPAILRLKQHPVPVLSAVKSPGGCRNAAASGAGLVIGSPTSMKRVGELIEMYRAAGGNQPVVLVCYAYVGEFDAIRKRLDSQVGLYRSYSTKEAIGHWAENPYITGPAKEVAENLAACVKQTGATALNIRVHIPGMTPDEIRGQTEAMAEVVQLLRKSGLK